MPEIKMVSGKAGKVYLVGAGPGDPELLTLKALGCLRRADVVVHDRLVDDRILNRVPETTERIFVGKKGGHYGLRQEAINELLVRRARRGQQVVRLKGGDPFLFGRGGEEALYLRHRGIPFEIVPGVSSALAAPAAAGIPVTHRGRSSSVTIVTGHPAAGSDSPIRWDLLARSSDTLIVLMPLGNLRQIVSRLILHGRPLDTPAALIESGTLEGQRSIQAPLGSIAGQARRAGIQSPALLVVGEVVELAGRLAQSYRFSNVGEPSLPMEAKQTS